MRQPEELLGESPDRLTLPERETYAGWWIALEFYTPETLPLRVIEAMGCSSQECIEILRKRGLNPAQFEYIPVRKG